MKTELEKVRQGVLGSETQKVEKLKKSVSGYPSFMKEKEDKLKHKELQRRDSEDFDELEQTLAEQGLEAQEDVPYFGSSTVEIMKTEFYQNHVEDLGDQLKERVDHAEDNPVPVSDAEESLDEEAEAQYVRGNTSAEKRSYLRKTGQELEIGDDIFDNDHLYHLNTKKNYVHPSSSDADLYDFHQRKSKEIRRLQYVAGLEKRKRKRRKPQAQPKPQPKPQYKPKQQQLRPKPEPKPKPETPPQAATPKIKTPEPTPSPSSLEPIELLYPIWVIHKMKPYPAELKMTLPPGTEINIEGQLEVREGDYVEVDIKPVNPKNWNGEDLKLPEGMVLPDLKGKFSGNTVAPNPEDGDCDFVVLDETPFDDGDIPNHLKNHPSFRSPRRYPILTNLRDIGNGNPLDDANCDVYDIDPSNDYQGRGNFKLLDDDGNHMRWAKGILSDNENTLSYVFVKRDQDNKIWLRQVSSYSEEEGYEFEVTLETYIIEELLYFPTLKSYVTKLTLKEELIDGENVKIPRQIYFIEGQECLESIDLVDGMYAFCRCEDGNDYYGTIEYDGDFGIKLNLDKTKYDYEDDYVRVIVDEPELLENYRNITTVFDKIDLMNSFRAGGPWITRNDTEDQSTQFTYEPETFSIAVGTENPKMKSQAIGTTPPKLISQGVGTTGPTMVSQSVDAVNEHKGLRLDNLQFGIVDGSGRRLRVIVQNEEDNQANDTEIQTVEFYKSSGTQNGSKQLGVQIGEPEFEENENETYTPVNITENIHKDQENFQGEVDLEFDNPRNVS